MSTPAAVTACEERSTLTDHQHLLVAGEVSASATISGSGCFTDCARGLYINIYMCVLLWSLVLVGPTKGWIRFGGAAMLFDKPGAPLLDVWSDSSESWWGGSSLTFALDVVSMSVYLVGVSFEVQISFWLSVIQRADTIVHSCLCMAPIPVQLLTKGAKRAFDQVTSSLVIYVIIFQDNLPEACVDSVSSTSLMSHVFSRALDSGLTGTITIRKPDIW